MTVIDLAEHRRERDEPSITEARLRFDGWLLLPFEPRTRQALDRRFALVWAAAAAGGDDLAETTLKLVVRTLSAPARISDPGERSSHFRAYRTSASMPRTYELSPSIVRIRTVAVRYSAFVICRPQVNAEC